MSDNLHIWDILGKTDPAHTKPFSRAGGFKGTALKPMWAIKQLTEQFGPVGMGWGTGEPRFELVHGQDGEVLVYCTVSVWHTDRANVSWGVGGDKAIAKNKNGLFHDDEAFKKAFTDATMNGFKSLGVGADIHMGQFDDNKYVAQMEREFAEREADALLADSDRELIVAIEACNTADDLDKWTAKHGPSVGKSPNADAIRAKFKARRNFINPPQKKAA